MLCFYFLFQYQQNLLDVSISIWAISCEPHINLKNIDLICDIWGQGLQGEKGSWKDVCKELRHLSPHHSSLYSFSPFLQ